MNTTAFGEAYLVTYMKVEKKDGRVLFYKVEDGNTVEISEETYLRETV